jgi:hypothetical protein
VLPQLFSGEDSEGVKELPGVRRERGAYQGHPDPTLEVVSQMGRREFDFPQGLKPSAYEVLSGTAEAVLF